MHLKQLDVMGINRFTTFQAKTLEMKSIFVVINRKELVLGIYSLER